MPIVESPYTAPFWLRNGHTQTMWPVLFRKIDILPAQRVRLATPDDDFIDVDIMRAATSPVRRAVILSHGLEGNTRRKYMQGMAKILLRNGWDVVARHLRGCSEEMNRQPGQYHMGATEDVHTVVQYCVAQGYDTLALAGFSMGGSQTLKYLGEAPQRVPPQVQAAVAISVPCDLVGASRKLASPACAVYMIYFMRTMHKKMRIKAAMHKDFPSIDNLERIRTFDVFDEHFTAPINGFRSAMDYWTQSGCGQFLQNIRIPALLLNAADDPFMTPSCFPWDVARRSPWLTLEVPAHGGHVGFVTTTPAYWSELRAAAYLHDIFGR